MKYKPLKKRVMDNNLIALVNENDEVTGYSNKMDVHRSGQLHRAFSIFIFNDDYKILLQRRALSKYHSGGLWTNACCSHLVFGDNFDSAVHCKLNQEMGFDCNLEHIFTFNYKTQLGNGLIENELDHVFLGHFNGSPNPNPAEVSEWKWADLIEVNTDLINNKDNYTYWFNIAFQKVLQHLEITVF
jgi:isopentenyl-diphosphate delta-isomerase